MRIRIIVAIGWCLTIAVAACVAWWAGRATFMPPKPLSSLAAPQVYTVAYGTLGQSTQLAVAVSWPSVPVGSAAFDGVVTTVGVEPGQVVNAGDELLTVNLLPVVVAQGSVPAFRDLSLGATGADVRQLQQMLAAGGHLNAARVTGKFDERTTAAVKVWQKSLDVDLSGSVSLGSVLFLPELPARVVLEKDVVVGAGITIGDPMVRSVAGTPVFEVDGNLDQRSDVPPTGTAVTVDVNGIVFSGAVHSLEPTDDGASVRLSLTAGDGTPMCGAQCASVPFGIEVQRFPGRALLAPEVSGAMVPVATLGTGADGSTFVVREDAGRTTVRVLATDGARAVVEGLSIGDVVRLFGDPVSAIDSEGPSAPGVSPTAPGTP